ncbi:MAG: 30S ribosome-binding factor RbfA [Planctomycetota bacterium]|nr:30S ribosome-binding factor RbfA [Planctomycetota bacterium]MCX8039697.1 30S ribosome-binding factor RbfA [Planctomycetota bacterium]MDW8372877.1 30S ribosome-binding factor RbfA [Planctomycetota bacterium]
MPGPSRRARLASLLHREIASCLLSLDDPRLTLVTITRVEVSGDLQIAKAYWTVLGGGRERRQAALALEGAKRVLRASYAPVVRTRLLPELVFAYDESDHRRERVLAAIRRARASDRDAAEDAASAETGDAEGEDRAP